METSTVIKCSACGQRLRIPLGRPLTLRCPSCGHQFWLEHAPAPSPPSPQAETNPSKPENSPQSVADTTPGHQPGPLPQPAPAHGQESPLDPKLAEMLANPKFVTDPVFPKENYLDPFGRWLFPALLQNAGKPEAAQGLRASKPTQQMAMLRAGSMGFWAIDLDVVSKGGATGRDEFISRVRKDLNPPPPGMEEFAVGQRVWCKGVAKIQIEGEPAQPDHQICSLRTIGWYAADFVSIRRA